MGSKDAAEFRRRYGRLRKGWKKILQQEHQFGSLRKEFNLRSLPTPKEAVMLQRLGRRLSEMGAKGIKVKPQQSSRKAKPITAKFVSGGLPGRAD